MVRRAGARPARPHGASVALGQIHFVIKTLAHLIHRDQVLIRAGAERDAGGAAKRKRRMTGQHVGVRIARRQARRDVKGGAGAEVLLHARQIGADAHAGDDAARVLPEGAQQRESARHERGLVEGRIKHAAELRIGAMTAAADHDGPPRPDVNGDTALVDVAILVIAFHARLGTWRARRKSRAIARPDPQHPSRERLLADDLGHPAVQHEAHALFTRAEL